jgi:hypothetical protein
MRSEWRHRALALAGFTLLTLAVFRPTPSELTHTSPAHQGMKGDALLLMWATSHVSKTLLTAPTTLFDAPIFWPARRTLAWGDHMIGQAVVGLPIWLATGNPLLEFNLLALASYALGATAAFVYARALGLPTAAAAAAGVVVAFTPFRFHSPLWLQVLFTPLVPLALLFWLRFVRDGRPRDWTAWVGCWWLHSLMGLYLMLYFGLVMGALGALALVAAPTRRRPRLWIGTLAAPLALLALLAPVLAPYLSLRATQGHVRTLGLDTTLAFFLPGPGTVTGALTGLGGHRAQFGPGLVASALALLGLVAARRCPDPWRRFVWAAHATGLAVVLLLVLTPVRLQLAIPGLDMARNTNRAFHVGLVFVAAFAAEGAAWLARRPPGPRARRWLGAALVALLALDAGTPPRERVRVPTGAELPPIYAAVRRMPEDVLYEREHGIEGPALAMYYSIFHGKRIVNGYSGFVGPGAAYLASRLFAFPDDEARRLLAALGVRAVLWRHPTPAALEAAVARLPAGVGVVARTGTDLLVRVRHGPPTPPTPPVRPAARDAWTLAASSGIDGLDALRDGDPETAWHGRAIANAGPPWLAIDLGASRPVAGVRVVPAGADTTAVSLATVELSDDGERWTPAGAPFRPESLVALLERPAARGAWAARFPPRPARWVRLVNAELVFWAGPWLALFESPWDIAELEVLTLAGAPE